MRKYFKAIRILAVLFSLSACITLTEEEKKVRIATSPDIVKNCRFIDSFITTRVDDIEDRIRRDTFKMGGDTALVQRTRVIAVYQCSKQSPQVN